MVQLLGLGGLVGLSFVVDWLVGWLCCCSWAAIVRQEEGWLVRLGLVVSLVGLLGGYLVGRSVGWLVDEGLAVLLPVGCDPKAGRGGLGGYVRFGCVVGRSVGCLVGWWLVG